MLYTNPRYLQGALLLLSSSLLFSLQAPLAHMAYQDGANAITVVWLRFLIPGLLLLIFFRRPLSLKRRNALITGFLYAISALLFYSTLNYLSAGLTVTLFFMAPVFVYLYTVVFRIEQLNHGKLLAISCSIIGVYLIGNSDSEISAIGLLLGLCASVTFSGYIITCNRLLPKSDGLACTGWIMVSGALLLTIPMLIGQSSFPESNSGWLACVTLSIFCGLIPVAMTLVGIQRLGNDTDASSFASTEPVAALIVAALLLGEALTLSNVSGMIMVITGTLLMSRLASNQQRNLLSVKNKN